MAERMFRDVCFWHIADSFRRRTACLLSGVKRTFFPQPNMSANDPKRTSLNLAPDGLDHENGTLGWHDAVQPQAG
jgi:hypothetical protein